jgi:hypothetical protein
MGKLQTMSILRKSVISDAIDSDDVCLFVCLEEITLLTFNAIKMCAA